MHAALGALGALLAGARRLVAGPRRLAALGALAFAALAAWPLHHASQALTAGDWIARQPWAASLRWGLLAAGLAAAATVGALHASGERRRLWPLLLLGGAAAAALADARVLPGLYAEAHRLLGGTSLVLVHLGVARLTPSVLPPGGRGCGPPWPRWRRWRWSAPPSP